MTNQPTPEEQLKNLDEKPLKEKANKRPSKGYGRGKYPRKSTASTAITPTIPTPKLVVPNTTTHALTTPPTHKPWPKITVTRSSQPDLFSPYCFQSYKLLHEAGKQYYTAKMISILQEIGILVEVFI